MPGASPELVSAELGIIMFVMDLIIEWLTE
jgi:hypothetical protein